MKIYLLAVGKKMPAWITEGYQDFSKRLKQEITLQLIEVDAAQRQKNGNVDKYKSLEAERILQAMPQNSYCIVLDEHGKQFSSQQLSDKMQDYLHMGRDICLIIGGADGLSQSLLQQAEERWSLSKLTLPHAQVRVLIAEQLYRAWSLMHGHPYHRE